MASGLGGRGVRKACPYVQFNLIWAIIAGFFLASELRWIRGLVGGLDKRRGQRKYNLEVELI